MGMQSMKAALLQGMAGASSHAGGSGKGKGGGGKGGGKSNSGSGSREGSFRFDSLSEIDAAGEPDLLDATRREPRAGGNAKGARYAWGEGGGDGEGDEDKFDDDVHRPRRK